MDNFLVDTYKLQIKLIFEVRRLTFSGKLKWKRNDEGIFFSKHKKLKVSLDFYNFARMDEESSDNSMVLFSIDVPDSEGYSNKLMFDYSIGTEAYNIIRETLAFSYDDWSSSWETGTKKNLKMLKYMSKL